MGRRKRDLIKFGPQKLAEIVIQNYLTKVRRDLTQMADNYLRDLRAAVTNELKMTIARAKLMAVYRTMIESGIIREYKNIYREARDAHMVNSEGIYERVV